MLGLLGELLRTKSKSCIRIAYQLLALGFGRRELHPGDLPVRDEHLKETRRILYRQPFLYYPDGTLTYELEWDSDFQPNVRRLVRHSRAL